jgi:hypothetical protein
MLVGDTVDPEHCILTWDGRRLYIEDLMSAFGVTVNADRVTAAEITPQDDVRIGEETTLAVENPSPENEGPAPLENMVLEVYDVPESPAFAPEPVKLARERVEPPPSDEAPPSNGDPDFLESPLKLRFEGEVTGFCLPEVVQCIARSHRTGTLYVQGQGRKVAIYFRDGKAVYATPSLPRDKIGELMLGRNLIQPVELYDALKQQKKLKRKGKFLRLGTLLVGMGVLKSATLIDCISEQIVKALNDVLAETEGDFVFEPHSTLQQEDVVAEVDINEILEGVEEVKSVLKNSGDVPSLYDVFKINADPATVNINLDLNEWKILSLIDGERDVKALSTKAHFPVFKILSVLAKLAELDLVCRIEGDTAAAALKRGNNGYKAPTADKGILKRILRKLRGH